MSLLSQFVRVPLADSTAIHTDIAGEIVGLTHKSAPAIDDFILIEDSASGNVKRYSTVGEVAETATSGMTNFSLAADTGTAEVIDDTETLTIAGGANVDTIVSATNTVTVALNGVTLNADTNVSTNSWVLDEDTMLSNDATKVPTQQSVKAYVDAVDSAKVDKVGDSMTGDLGMSGNLVTGLGAPTADNDAVRKIYVDSAIAGLSWKNSVVAATTANFNLATGGTANVDGVTISAGDRILVLNQTAPAENGVYIAATGAWSRATDFDAADEINGAAVYIEAGSTYADVGFTVTSNVVTLGTDAITMVQFNGASGITAGTGLAKTGNTLNVNLGAGIKETPTDEVGVDTYATGGLFTTADGSTASTVTSAQLAINLDGTTLTMGASGIRVSTAIITEIDAIETGAGLGTDGSYTANASANYISGATDLKHADDLLDAAIKTVSDQSVTKLNASAYTADDVLAKIKTVDGAGSGLDADLLDGHSSSYFLTTTGNAVSATKLATARTIDITGDITASAVAFDGTSNITISAAVVNDSHTHDTRYYTESESDGRFLRGDTSDTMSGNLTVDAGVNTTLTVKCDDTGLASIRAYGDSQGTGAIEVGQSATYGGGICYNGDDSPGYITGESSDQITFFNNNSGVRSKVFSYPHDSSSVTFVGTVIAPAFSGALSGTAAKATKLVTARTIDITGDITATAVAFDGTANIAISAQVNNDSHTHDTRYYTESESDSRFLGKTAKAADADKLDGINSSSFLRSDANDTYTGTLTIVGSVVGATNIESKKYTGTDSAGSPKFEMVWNSTEESIDFNFI